MEITLFTKQKGEEAPVLERQNTFQSVGRSARVRGLNLMTGRDLFTLLVEVQRTKEG